MSISSYALLCSVPETFSMEHKTFTVDYKALLGPTIDPGVRDAAYSKPYLDFMQEVFDTMDREYYAPISKETYDEFREEYLIKVIARLKDKETVIPEIKYLGAGLLVQKLKDPTDIFSGFLPPKETEEFKSEVLGYEQGIGLTGTMTDKGYLINRVEFRSDSYAKGLRPGDILLKIDGADVIKMNEEQLKKALFPPLGTKLLLDIFFAETKVEKQVEVEVIEFFKETLASVPTGVPGMYYIKINQFNQTTGDDFTKLLTYYMTKGMNKLIIDLRGNGGGPPLAAREIASHLLPAGTDLFYFQRKNRPKILLRTLPSRIHYTGDLAILVDKGSGSASELFAGTLQKRGRAFLVGAENSAGKTFLKSMYNFEDKSMVILVTSLAYLYNGNTYDPSGLKPDFHAQPDVDLFGFLAKCFEQYDKK